MLERMYDVISVWKSPLLVISLWSGVVWSWWVLGKYGNMIIIH